MCVQCGSACSRLLGVSFFFATMYLKINCTRDANATCKYVCSPHSPNRAHAFAFLFTVPRDWLDFKNKSKQNKTKQTKNSQSNTSPSTAGPPAVRGHSWPGRALWSLSKRGSTRSSRLAGQAMSRSRQRPRGHLPAAPRHIQHTSLHPPPPHPRSPTLTPHCHYTNRTSTSTLVYIA